MIAENWLTKKPVASEVYPGSQRDIFVKTKAKVKTLPVYQDMPIYCPPPPPFFSKKKRKEKENPANNIYLHISCLLLLGQIHAAKLQA